MRSLRAPLALVAVAGLAAGSLLPIVDDYESVPPSSAELGALSLDFVSSGGQSLASLLELGLGLGVDTLGDLVLGLLSRRHQDDRRTDETGGRAVILGEAGRNFGAGMSGGIAFVLDEDDTFVSRVNPEMVDIDPMSDDEIEWLQDRIQRHQAETGSAVAEQLLADWATSVTKFKKVMPRDYKRVLEAMARAERDGIDVNEAVMAATTG